MRTKNMRTYRLAALAAFATLTVSGVAQASSHREAPAIAADPSADNTDTYAWVDNNGNLVVVANYIGLEIPEGGPNWAAFSDDVLYEIHVARGPMSLADALTYQIRFNTAPYPYLDPAMLQPPGAGKGQEFFAQLSGGGAFNQTYTVTKIEGATVTTLGTFKVPPPNVGPTTDQVAHGFALNETYEQHWVDGAMGTIGTLQNGEGRVFAGPRDDPFYVDLGAVFDLAQLRPVRGLLAGKNLDGGASSRVVCNPAGGCQARDSVKYHNVHSIVLEIPGIKANGGQAVTPGPSAAQTVGVWASASRRKVRVQRNDGRDTQIGPWRQVSRLGLPLINEAVIGLQDKDKWNRLTPADDAPVFGSYFDKPIIARDAEAVGIYNILPMCKIQNGGPPKTGRLGDIEPVINLKVLNAAYNGIMSVGDVLRVDLGTKLADFPNGRRLNTSGTSNVETVDVTDTELKMLICSLTNAGANTGLMAPNALTPNTPYGGIPDGANTNEVSFRATFPYLAPPWQGFAANPHAAPVP
jgi:hypothetical protein